MKLSFVIAIATTALLAGCQTSTYMTSAAADGDGVTCAKIYQAFDSYESDRQSASALAELGTLVSPAAGSYANMGVNQASKYYEEIKASANIALTIRGCQPIQ